MRTCKPLLICAALGAAMPVAATVPDPNWTETVFSINRNDAGDTTGKQHTGLAWAPDGSDRLFVLEKTGRVRILSGSLTTPTPVWSTFATMSPINSTFECGLVGMAFDPNFAQNRWVYFFVTVSATEQQLLRYDASTNVGSGRTVIVSGLPTRNANHNGGAIGFARDGKLYWSIGDNGNGTGVNADLTSLAAKMGRANRDGSVPADNPFVDGAGPNNDYIFARGLRNPFTLQIQPSTGLIWSNVVGTSYEQVFIVGRGDHAGYNAFENNQPATFITPRIVYRTNGSDVRTFVANSASRSGNVATFSTTAVHGFRVGGNITIAGVSDASFNGANQYIAGVPSSTSFTVQQVGPDATSNGGTAQTLNQGGCLTGGAFYDATLAPADFRGNFFYGDCNSGRIMRARIDAASNQVLSVDYWATDINAQVDVASGPDGALYYIGTSTNNVYRAAYNATGQALVVANQNLHLEEGGDAITTVSLAMQPSVAVQVTVGRTGGDSDVSVAAGSTLTFTAIDWMRPQSVRLNAAADADSVDDTASISVASPSLATVPISVTVLDLAPAANIFADGFE
jgi:glucose/arabinose dehydrogenase